MRERGITTPDAQIEEILGSLATENQEQVKNILVQLEGIREGMKTKRWPEFRPDWEIDEVLPEARETAQRLFDSLRPFNTDNMWSTALNRAMSMNRTVLFDDYRKLNQLEFLIINGGREIDFESIWDELTLWHEWDRRGQTGETPSRFLKRLNEMNRDVHQTVANAAVLEAFRGQAGFIDNPWLHKFSLYTLGAGRIQFRHVYDELSKKEESGRGIRRHTEKLTIDFPLAWWERAWGCVVFGDGEPGDSEVRFYHTWNEDCKAIKPIIDSPRDIV